MVAMNKDLWMYEYNRTFDNELNNGLTETEAETLADAAADVAVYYGKTASMGELRAELETRDLPITGRRLQLVKRILTNNTEKRKQEIEKEPEITPEPTIVITPRRSARLIAQAIPYF